MRGGVLPGQVAVQQRAKYKPTPWANSESPVNLTCMFSVLGEKAWVPGENSCSRKGEHANSVQKSRPRTFFLWGSSVNHNITDPLISGPTVKTNKLWILLKNVNHSACPHKFPMTHFFEFQQSRSGIVGGLIGHLKPNNQTGLFGRLKSAF